MIVDFLLLFEDTPKNPALQFYYALKSMLEKGDNFELLTNRPETKSTACQFTYNGTRKIKVFIAVFSYGGEDVANTTVTLFDITNGSEKLDTNVFHNPRAKGTYELSFDPSITDAQSCVNYVQAVLDRDDRDKEYTPPEATPAPTTRKPVFV